MEQTLPTVTEINCKLCSQAVSETQKYCTSCGFPINGSEYEEKLYHFRRDAKAMQLERLHKPIQQARNTLWVIAGINFLYGLAISSFSRGYDYDNPLAVLLSIIIVSGLFVALGFWAKQKPFTALLSGLIMYATLYLYGVVVEGMSPVSGILVRAIIVIYLIKGINSAKEAEQLKKELNR